MKTEKTIGGKTVDGWTNGYPYHLTGETRTTSSGAEWLVAEVLQGYMRGREIILPRPEDVEARVRAQRELWDRQQAAYRRLRPAQNH